MVKVMNLIIGYITLTLVLIIISIFCLNFTRDLLTTNNVEQTGLNLFPDMSMDIMFARNGIVDCQKSKLPCVTDRQCLDNCSSQTLAGEIVCQQGFCVTRDAQVAGVRPDDFECDASLGLVKVYVASEFVVQQLCVSTYRDVVDDLGAIRPYICENGSLSLDLINRPFTVDDCDCDAGYTRMAFNQTALARAIPVCIPNNLNMIYSKIYESTL